MDTLRELLQREDSDAPLDLAALELSRIEFPHLDPQPFLDILDSYATEIDARLRMEFDGMERLQVLHEFFFREQGFTGNDADYYNPRNSCLNEVIAERRGIPISLAVVYLSIAERLEMPLAGVGMPGHFIVRYDEDDFQTFVDVYNNGQLMDEEQCFALGRQMTGMDITSSPGILTAVTNRQIMVRMLNNLRSIYLHGKSYVKAGQVLDLLLEASPSDADSYILRGAVNVELRKYKAAKADFEQYLALSPHARDRQRVEDQIAALDRYLIRSTGV
ncbi:MAG TPA: transglutaminase-like domain-containing protein [Bryobacteraceae bacterium]|nr:transglutaminase-like domain-containing protein [Bryobacteraceae bacterium]